MAESLSFVSQKMSRVRWKPVASSRHKSETFACGSYEDTCNTVSVWSVGHMTSNINQQINNYMDDFETSQPNKIADYQTNSSVGGLEYIDMHTLVAGLSNGTVLVLRVDMDLQKISEQQCWSQHHKTFVTDVAASIPNVVSVDEDGTINLMRIDTLQPLRVYDSVDSSPITSVHYLSSNEICTTNMAGQLRTYDVRSPSDCPARTMVSSETLVALCSVDHHPTQGHILATGGADGCVTLFDARKECTPVTKLQVHDQDVWELRFHKSSPQHLFTCSQDGSVRRLDTNFDPKALANQLGAVSPVEVSELLSQCGISINSIDSCGDMLLCCSDAEAIYIVNDAI